MKGKKVKKVQNDSFDVLDLQQLSKLNGGINTPPTNDGPDGPGGGTHPDDDGTTNGGKV